MSMKTTILRNVDEFFIYEDLAALLPNNPKHSIMARVHELITDNKIVRVRLATKTKRAVYAKL